MPAAVLNEVGQPFSLESADLESPREREVLVRVAAVPGVFIPNLLDLCAQGRFPFDRLITGCGGLGQINDAIESGDVVKAVRSVAG